MDLLQLRYFCHAAVTENFSRTAQAFYVPASAVSISVKRLETELDTPLFHRTGNRVKLNPQGQYYFECIRQALDLIDGGSRTLQKKSTAEHIRVGFRLGRRGVLRSIDIFQKQYPDVDVAVSEFGPESQLKDFDIVVTDDSPEHENYSKAVVLQDKLMVVAAKGFLPKGELTKEFLQEQTFISLPTSSVMYKNTLRVCRDLGFEPTVITPEKDSVYFVPHHLEMGDGVAITYPQANWLSFMAHLVEMRDIGNYYHTVCCYRRKKNASPYVSRLYDIMADYYKVNFKSLHLSSQ